MVCQIARHEVHAVGKVLPGATDTFDYRLATEFTFRADLARDARHFRGKRVQLIHHRVHGVLEFENFSLYIDRDLLRQIAVRDRRRDERNVAHLRRKVTGHNVHRIGQILPCP